MKGGKEEEEEGEEGGSMALLGRAEGISFLKTIIIFLNNMR